MLTIETAPLGRVAQPVATADELVWTRPEWLAEATAWIRSQLRERGLEVSGAMEQPHVFWWSTVLRVPTGVGTVWFKATQSVHSFEPRLTALLADVRPEATAVPLALDGNRGWMLTDDAGVRLRDLATGREQVERWEELLPRYAELQIELAPRSDELLELGVPNGRLDELPRLLAEALDDRSALVGDREDSLSSKEYSLLRRAQPEFTRLCRELAGYGIPETIQHDDLHDGNVFVRDGTYVFFDWGDSCVSHPFHTLVVTLRALAWKLDPQIAPGGPELKRLRDAYLEPWSSFGTRDELLEAFRLAYRTGTVARALAWRRFVLARDPAERDPEDADAVAYGLKLFLANGPTGTWR
jgi:Phosphotransferase enzyme family